MRSVFFNKRCAWKLFTLHCLFGHTFFWLSVLFLRYFTVFYGILRYFPLFCAVFSWITKFFIWHFFLLRNFYNFSNIWDIFSTFDFLLMIVFWEILKSCRFSFDLFNFEGFVLDFISFNISWTFLVKITIKKILCLPLKKEYQKFE